MPEDESIPVAFESVEAVKVCEEKPVLDVHAPHSGVHTWKDFWIHLGTITLGLLIAISLEQSVEWVHHLHERHQLEEDLLAECARNHAIVQGDLRTFGVQRVWLIGLRDEVKRMRDSGGTLKLPYPPLPESDPDTKGPLPHITLPSDAVWSTAKESALVVLLPRTEAEMYARYGWAHDLLKDAANAWIASETERGGFEDAFDEAGPKSVPDLSRMSASELEAYSALLNRDISMRGALSYRITNFDSETQGILGGARTEEELIRSLK